VWHKFFGFLVEMRASTSSASASGSSRINREIRPEIAEAYDILDAINDNSVPSYQALHHSLKKRKKRKRPDAVTAAGNDETWEDGTGGQGGTGDSKYDQDFRKQHATYLECFGLEPQVTECLKDQHPTQIQDNKYDASDRAIVSSNWPVVRPRFPELIKCNPFGNFIDKQQSFRRPLLVCPNLYDQFINEDAIKTTLLDSDHSHRYYPRAFDCNISVEHGLQWQSRGHVNTPIYSLEPFRPAPIPLLNLIRNKSELLADYDSKVRLFDLHEFKNTSVVKNTWEHAADRILLPDELFVHRSSDEQGQTDTRAGSTNKSSDDTFHGCFGEKESASKKTDVKVCFEVGLVSFRMKDCLHSLGTSVAISTRKTSRRSYRFSPSLGLYCQAYSIGVPFLIFSFVCIDHRCSNSLSRLWLLRLA
jgi:hypothetical protein